MKIIIHKELSADKKNCWIVYNCRNIISFNIYDHRFYITKKTRPREIVKNLLGASNYLFEGDIPNYKLERKCHYLDMNKVEIN